MFSASTAPADGLNDAFGRRFHYLRLSVTDACNFRCIYCLPNGYKRPEGALPPLTPTEVERLVRAFAGLGVWKFRFTGGEPTLRRDLLELISRARGVPGVSRLALSTNGYRLKELAEPLHTAGITALNISLNSLKPSVYQQITGQDRLHDVLAGIDRALTLGYDAVKLNVVLLKGVNDGEVDDFFALARSRPLSVRFIELMPTTLNQQTHGMRLASEGVAIRLLEEGWLKRIRASDSGPAVEFTHPLAQGSVGYIAPYDKSFCTTCNRLRVTSQGQLRLCLFGEGGASLKNYLQEDQQLESLQSEILRLLEHKRVAHRLSDGIVGETPSFSVMGG
jgi:cyclic pyranopterin phosphate synthase